MQSKDRKFEICLVLFQQTTLKWPKPPPAQVICSSSPEPQILTTSQVTGSNKLIARFNLTLWNKRKVNGLEFCLCCRGYGKLEKLAAFWFWIIIRRNATFLPILSTQSHASSQRWGLFCSDPTIWNQYNTIQYNTIQYNTRMNNYSNLVSGQTQGRSQGWAKGPRAFSQNVGAPPVLAM